MSITLSLKLFNRSKSNEALMLRYAETGDKHLLGQLYDNCANDLYHYVLTQTPSAGGDTSLARDICQKSWLRVMEKGHLYRREGSFKAWLFTLTRNLLIDELRSTQRWDMLQEQHVPHTEAGVPSTLQQAFNQALEQLPFEQREAFCLQQEGFSLSELAGITQVGIETAKSRLRYAKSSLRAQLGHFYDSVE